MQAFLKSKGFKGASLNAKMARLDLEKTTQPELPGLEGATEHCELDTENWNADLAEASLKDKRNPRWVAKPTVAYLWARTVTCKNCRATIPLLKTRWLAKKDKKRWGLSIQLNADITGVVFGV